MIGDCDATRALSTESGFLQVGGFCERIHVGNFVIVGEGTRASPDEMVFATTLTITDGTDVLSDGDLTIFFSLGRQPNGAWRVTGGGTGP